VTISRKIFQKMFNMTYFQIKYRLSFKRWRGSLNRHVRLSCNIAIWAEVVLERRLSAFESQRSNELRLRPRRRLNRQTMVLLPFYTQRYQ
jgi:hypothetical protein